MNNETASNCLQEILESIDGGAAPNVVGATAISNRDAIRKAVKTLKPKSRPRESNEDEDYYYF